MDAGEYTFFEETVTGAVLVGALLSFCGFGVIAHQASTYATMYPHDRAVFKTMAATCVLLCLVDTVVNGSWCYKWLVTGYGNPEVVTQAPWEFAASLFIGWTHEYARAMFLRLENSQGLQ